VPEGVLLARLDALITATTHIMGHGQNGTPIQKDLDDLIVVAMGSQDQGRNIWRESGSILRGGFPALEKIIIHLIFDRSKVTFFHSHDCPRCERSNFIVVSLLYYLIVVALLLRFTIKQ